MALADLLTFERVLEGRRERERLKEKIKVTFRIFDRVIPKGVDALTLPFYKVILRKKKDLYRGIKKLGKE